MFDIRQALISYPKKCKKCKNLILFPCELIDNNYYYKCSFCLESFLWTSNTLFDRSLISFSKFEKLILLYIENKSVRETYEIMINSEETKLNKKTVARYFNLLNLFSFEFYMEKLDSTFFDGEVELDETLLFKEKKQQQSIEDIN